MPFISIKKLRPSQIQVQLEVGIKVGRWDNRNKGELFCCG